VGVEDIFKHLNVRRLEMKNLHQYIDQKKIITLFICLLFSLPIYALCVFNKTGTDLYLNRNAFETHRAVFDYAEDCQLIARIMSKEEIATWYCK